MADTDYRSPATTTNGKTDAQLKAEAAKKAAEAKPKPTTPNDVPGDGGAKRAAEALANRKRQLAQAMGDE